MASLVYILVFLALTGYSSGASYCLCKDGVSEQSLQRAIDYACGYGGDCTAILQNGACYLPNTIKDHCSYAVNSYFQKKGQASGSCDFSGTATQSANPPSSQTSTCVYPSSGSTSTTPSGNTPSSTTPTTPPTSTGTGTGTGSTGTGTGSTGTGTGTGTGTSTGTGTGTGTSTGTGTGTGTTTMIPSPFGISPSGFDPTGDAPALTGNWLLVSSALTLLWLLGFMLRN